MSAGTTHRPGVVPRLAAIRRSRVPLSAWALTKETVRVCMRYRVTGLASEAGFFALLSLPPLLLGLVGGVGYVGKAIGQDTVVQVQNAIHTYASQVFRQKSVVDTITDSISAVLGRGRFDIISIAFVLSLWSGSRVLNVFLDTISIMYGQGGLRGIVKSRALSFGLYTVAVLVGAVVLPLVLLGPTLLDQIVPNGLDWLVNLYWPVVALLALASLGSLYHVATPRRSAWRRELPGAVLAFAIWVGASVVLRVVIAHSVGGASIYGPLAATIIVLIWLYFLSIAVLIGAALNAAIRELWPHPDDPRPTERRRRRTDSGPVPVTPVHERSPSLPGSREH